MVGVVGSATAGSGVSSGPSVSPEPHAASPSAMTVAAAPLIDYTRATGAQLLAPGAYLEQVRAALPEMRNP